MSTHLRSNFHIVSNMLLKSGLNLIPVDKDGIELEVTQNQNFDIKSFIGGLTPSNLPDELDGYAIRCGVSSSTIGFEINPSNKPEGIELWNSMMRKYGITSAKVSIGRLTLYLPYYSLSYGTSNGFYYIIWFFGGKLQVDEKSRPIDVIWNGELVMAPYSCYRGSVKAEGPITGRRGGIEIVISNIDDDFVRDVAHGSRTSTEPYSMPSQIKSKPSRVFKSVSSRANGGSFINDHIFRVWSREDDAKYQRILTWFVKTMKDPIFQRIPLVICNEAPPGVYHSTQFFIELFGEEMVDIIFDHNCKPDEDKLVTIVDNPIKGCLDSFINKAYIIFASDCGITSQDPRYLVVRCDTKRYTREYRKLLPLMCDKEEIYKFEVILSKLQDDTPAFRELTKEERYIENLSSGKREFMLDKSFIYFLNKGDFVTTEDLFEHHVGWCIKNGIKSGNRNSFSRRIRSLKFGMLSRVMIREGRDIKKRTGIYLNVLINSYDREKHIAN